MNFSKSNSRDPELRKLKKKKNHRNYRVFLITWEKSNLQKIIQIQRFRNQKLTVNLDFQHHIWCLLGLDFFHLRWNSQRTNFICNLYSVHYYSKCQTLRSKWRSRIDQKKNVYNFGSSPSNRSLLRSRHVDQIRIQAIRLDPNEVPKA